MLRSWKALYFLIVAAVAAPAAPATVGWQHAGDVQSVERLQAGVELTAGAAKVRVTFVCDGVVRVRLAPNSAFPKDHSWAVLNSAIAPPPEVRIEDSAAQVTLASGGVVVQISKSPLLVNFLDAQGNVILADQPSLPMAWNGGYVRVWKKMPLEEAYYGLGDKAGPMDRRNRAFTMWNTDAFGWQESTDPLYKTIPFFIGLFHGRAYGVFFDNTWRSSFDFGKESRDFFSFGADGGELNYYYFAGPAPKTVVQEYSALVGRTPLPPLWTLGYQQSRYSYYPESEVREIAARLREDRIPADAIYLDIDYQQGYAPFIVNREYFPTFEKMIRDLRSQGLRTVLITDLHIKENPGHGYYPYDSGMKDDVFMKNPDGSVYVGKVWPGPSVFPDFTLSRVREWWGSLYKNFVEMGAAGFWNDMNEPAVFRYPQKTAPLDVVNRLDDGSTTTQRAVHNIFGMENARATYEGLRRLQGNERPFVLTRAAYSGAQRYAATWTGDNLATWNHIGMSTPMLLSMGVSGYPLAGDDIGGFGSTPPAGLLTRWFELGAFNPIFRNHAAKDTGRHEPWANGPEQEAIRRKYIELRYRLLPYVYSSAEEMSRTGMPLMRALFLEYPALEGDHPFDRDFLFGPDLLVSPVVTETVDAHVVELPPGQWYDFWSSARLGGGAKVKLHPKLDEVPLYVRAGAIIPEQPLVQSTSETPNGPLELRVYAGDDCRGTLYQDDGHTFNYENGEFLRVNYSCEVSPQGISVTSAIASSGYRPWWDSAALEVTGVASRPREVTVNGHTIKDWKYREADKTVSFTITGARSNWTAALAY